MEKKTPIQGTDQDPNSPDPQFGVLGASAPVEESTDTSGNMEVDEGTDGDDTQPGTGTAIGGSTAG
ncbi:hypothetical protein [Tellurirhabdus bombi]|uniref:hypothetical protein n=1 Tax=Tellurirhabdus bombi TaxID=2907205 RepID=UPI001F2BCF99|nr:hypothetical protein [Tellurirhabdus bombi]